MRASKTYNKLRTGYTTGLCAAAAAKAAATALLSEQPVGRIEIAAANGELARFEILDAVIIDGEAKCSVKKDAGDDPDVTNGVKIFASVRKTDTGQIEIEGGEGVGVVTKPGLKVPVGRAAINPGPMKMIETAVKGVCEQFSFSGGMRVVISIPGGAEIAKRTMNERLGVVGGLSILGTTGIVEPMSENAVIETIKTEIDVLAASGSNHLIITPGNYGKNFAKEIFGHDADTAVKCSNYIGVTLDYACSTGIGHITIVGHAGKLVKLAGGIMNTHSGIADCRMEIIAAHCALAGADKAFIGKIMDCATVEAAVALMLRTGINGIVWESIGKKIGYHLRERIKKHSEHNRNETEMEYVVFTVEHGILTRASTST